jgi:hypothetical protein
MKYILFTLLLCWVFTITYLNKKITTSYKFLSIVYLQTVLHIVIFHIFSNKRLKIQCITKDICRYCTVILKIYVGILCLCFRTSCVKIGYGYQLDVHFLLKVLYWCSTCFGPFDPSSGDCCWCYIQFLAPIWLPVDNKVV